MTSANHSITTVSRAMTPHSSSSPVLGRSLCAPPLRMNKAPAASATGPTRAPRIVLAMRRSPPENRLVHDVAVANARPPVTAARRRVPPICSTSASSVTVPPTVATKPRLAPPLSLDDPTPVDSATGPVSGLPPSTLRVNTISSGRTSVTRATRAPAATSSAATRRSVWRSGHPGWNIRTPSESTTPARAMPPAVSAQGPRPVRPTCS